MFTTPCYIRKNTPELRQKLEELGYTEDTHILSYMKRGKIYVYLTVTNIGRYWFSTELSNHNHSIDCGTNEQLFLALAALRDNSDYKQWFITSKGKWILSKYHKKRCNSLYNGKWRVTARKATEEELIKHFTSNNR